MHRQSLTGKFPWNTDPPSNGQHYPHWAVWGFYTEAVNPRQVVHNEEHGGVILWWGTKVSQTTVDAAARVLQRAAGRRVRHAVPEARQQGRDHGVDGEPRQVQDRTATTARATSPSARRYDAATKKAFEAFRKAYRGHGPEGDPALGRQAGHGPSVRINRPCRGGGTGQTRPA